MPVSTAVGTPESVGSLDDKQCVSFVSPVVPTLSYFLCIMPVTMYVSHLQVNPLGLQIAPFYGWNSLL